jgi:hypothetical protein
MMNKILGRDSAPCAVMLLDIHDSAIKPLTAHARSRQRIMLGIV